MACSSCSRFLHAVFFALNILSISVYILIVEAISVLSRSFLKNQWKKIRIKIKSQWAELLAPVLLGNSHPLLQRENCCGLTRICLGWEINHTS